MRADMLAAECSRKKVGGRRLAVGVVKLACHPERQSRDLGGRAVREIDLRATRPPGSLDSARDDDAIYTPTTDNRQPSNPAT